MKENQHIRLEQSWKSRLENEFALPYMQELRAFLQQRKQQSAVIYPPGSRIFNALDSTPFENVKVVILGQDPYHGPGQAHGLCFSVRDGVQTPPSLQNIYKEIHEDLGIPIPAGGNLEAWAKQGVLLLNRLLNLSKK